MDGEGGERGVVVGDDLRTRRRRNGGGRGGGVAHVVAGGGRNKGVRGKVAAPSLKVGGKCRGAGEKHQAQINN
jgi:hypothetical protein